MDENTPTGGALGALTDIAATDPLASIYPKLGDMAGTEGTTYICVHKTETGMQVGYRYLGKSKDGSVDVYRIRIQAPKDIFMLVKGDGGLWPPFGFRQKKQQSHVSIEVVFQQAEQALKLAISWTNEVDPTKIEVDKSVVLAAFEAAKKGCGCAECAAKKDGPNVDEDPHGGLN